MNQHLHKGLLAEAEVASYSSALLGRGRQVPDSWLQFSSHDWLQVSPLLESKLTNPVFLDITPTKYDGLEVSFFQGGLVSSFFTETAFPCTKLFFFFFIRLWLFCQIQMMGSNFAVETDSWISASCWCKIYLYFLLERSLNKPNYPLTVYSVSDSLRCVHCPPGYRCL